MAFSKWHQLEKLEPLRYVAEAKPYGYLKRLLIALCHIK